MSYPVNRSVDHSINEKYKNNKIKFDTYYDYNEFPNETLGKFSNNTSTDYDSLMSHTKLGIFKNNIYKSESKIKINNNNKINVIKNLFLTPRHKKQNNSEIVSNTEFLQTKYEERVSEIRKEFSNVSLLRDSLINKYKNKYNIKIDYENDERLMQTYQYNSSKLQFSPKISNKSIEIFKSSSNNNQNVFTRLNSKKDISISKDKIEQDKKFTFSPLISPRSRKIIKNKEKNDEKVYSEEFEANYIKYENKLALIEQMIDKLNNCKSQRNSPDKNWDWDSFLNRNKNTKHENSLKTNTLINQDHFRHYPTINTNSIRITLEKNSHIMDKEDDMHYIKNRIKFYRQQNNFEFRLFNYNDIKEKNAKIKEKETNYFDKLLQEKPAISEKSINYSLNKVTALEQLNLYNRNEERREYERIQMEKAKPKPIIRKQKIEKKRSAEFFKEASTKDIVTKHKVKRTIKEGIVKGITSNLFQKLIKAQIKLPFSLPKKEDQIKEENEYANDNDNEND